ncbi:hypothetical protein E1264_05840 [Actinomadura sp. KC216]|uniref:YdcF family protein n=1 Tax=Actinomadura sp. KC216 TaxID=2530370 RepID=UPI0010440D08|nr:YdcF family protein [Actinomadura sp. KC216]TDB90164.1 hypothetical protein E1264_05840 [Actinomadura sp. KC216]
MFTASVVVERDGRPLRAHHLVVDGGSGARWRAGHPAPADVRITVPEAVPDLVRAGRATGTSVVMSGLVGIEGDRRGLAALTHAVGGPGFRPCLAGATSPPAAAEPTAAAGRVPLVVVVLAAPNDERGRLSVMAEDRTRAAVDLARRTPGSRIVLTGGFGKQFNTTPEPHWKHCLRWLEPQGVLPKDVLACLETRHTYDDLLFLRQLRDHHPFADASLITSDYHAARVRYITRLVLPGCRVVAVPHPDLPAERLAAFSEHESEALAKTVAATLLFGPDFLPTPLERRPGDANDPDVLRPPPV